MRTRAGFLFMANNHYNKKALTIEEQISLLKSRGLAFSDEKQATHFLSYISYYRFSGYTISFEEKNQTSDRSHKFKPAVDFNDVLKLYDFDRHLRILVMDAIERIEVAIRTQICLQMSTRYNDSHWHLNQDVFKPEFRHAQFIEKCRIEQSSSNELFVRHYKLKYSVPDEIPSWMAVELLPLGTWSLVYKHLKERADKKAISDNFKLSPVDLESWLHALTYIRNLCAHHSRLWNRNFTIKPSVIRPHQEHLNPNYTFAAQAAMLHILLNVISPDNKWTAKLSELLDSHDFINPHRMGFSATWKVNSFWNL
jgi:abortive infection bacteriophage resistance protein